MTDKKPRWAWSSVDDPNPIYPKCDSCEAFARWAIASYEVGVLRDGWVTRFFACGRHIANILTYQADEESMVYDITVPPERG